MALSDIRSLRCFTSLYIILRKLPADVLCQNLEERVGSNMGYWKDEWDLTWERQRECGERGRREGPECQGVSHPSGQSRAGGSRRDCVKKKTGCRAQHLTRGENIQVDSHTSRKFAAETVINSEETELI